MIVKITWQWYGKTYRYEIHGDKDTGYRIYSVNKGNYIFSRYTNSLVANDVLQRWLRSWKKR